MASLVSGAAAGAELGCKDAHAIYDSALTVDRTRLKTLSNEKPAIVPSRPFPTENPQADALVVQAVEKRNRSQYDAALKLLAEAQAIYRPDGAAYAYTLYQKGVIHSRMRKREEALKDLARALEIYRAMPEPDLRGIAEALLARGFVERGSARFTEAFETFEELRAVLRSDPAADPVDIADVMVQQGITHTRVGDNESALAAFEEALAFANGKLGRKSDMAAKALHNIAVTHRAMKTYPQAFEAFAQTRAILETHDPPRPIPLAEAIEETAKTYSNLQCLDEPVELLASAVKLYEAETGFTSDRVANTKHRLGRALREAGKAGEALIPLTEAALIFEENLGRANLRSAEVETDLALAYSRIGEHQIAKSIALSAIKTFEAGGASSLEGLRQAHWAYAQVLRAAGDLRAAIVFAKKAVNTQQEIRARNAKLPLAQRASFSARYRQLYDFLADALIETGRLQEAQFALDLVKRQEAFEFVRGDAKQEDDVKGAIALTAAEQTLSTAMEKELKSVSPIAADLEVQALMQRAKAGELSSEDKARLAALHKARYAGFKAALDAVKSIAAGVETEPEAVQREIVELQLKMLGQARKKLRQFGGRAVMLQAASLEDSLHLFVTSTHAAIHREVQISRKELRKLAFKAWSGVARRDPVADDALRELHRLLIAPVANDLSAAKADVLMLNLAGFLRYIPFAALNENNRYLVEDYALALYTPAADTNYAAATKDRSRAIGFGVTEALRDFAGLPGVADELESIFEGADAKGPFAGSPLLNGAFNAEAFTRAISNSPQYIHIASHFKLTPGDETQSFLLLGDGSELTLDRLRTDPALQFEDVDLLTLSACETAGEVSSEGDEVESFATLAQGSGASSVMATLWPISDASTARLMADFYDGLLNDNLDKATALRRAQVAMLRGIAPSDVPPARRGVTIVDDETDVTAPEVTAHHPHYWAAFILMGNWL